LKAEKASSSQLGRSELTPEFFHLQHFLFDSKFAKSAKSGFKSMAPKLKEIFWIHKKYLADNLWMGHHSAQVAESIRKRRWRTFGWNFPKNVPFHGRPCQVQIARYNSIL
jgi:hypothetical protein